MIYGIKAKNSFKWPDVSNLVESFSKAKWQHINMNIVTESHVPFMII